MVALKIAARSRASQSGWEGNEALGWEQSLMWSKSRSLQTLISLKPVEIRGSGKGVRRGRESGGLGIFGKIWAFRELFLKVVIWWAVRENWHPPSKSQRTLLKWAVTASYFGWRGCATSEGTCAASSEMSGGTYPCVPAQGSCAKAIPTDFFFLSLHLPFCNLSTLGFFVYPPQKKWGKYIPLFLITFFEFILPSLSRTDLVLLRACPFLHVGLEFVHTVFHPTFFSGYVSAFFFFETTLYSVMVQHGAAYPC